MAAQTGCIYISGTEIDSVAIQTVNPAFSTIWQVQESARKWSRQWPTKVQYNTVVFSYAFPMCTCIYAIWKCRNNNFAVVCHSNNCAVCWSTEKAWISGLLTVYRPMSPEISAYVRFGRPYWYFGLSVDVAIIWEHFLWTFHGWKPQICTRISYLALLLPEIKPWSHTYTRVSYFRFWVLLFPVSTLLYLHCESKKTRHYNIVHNFAECWPILKFFSLTDSLVNMQQNRH